MSETSSSAALTARALDDLRQGGILSRRLPGYEERPAQLEMTELVIRALGAEVPLLCEAGTGTGKSLSYLIPIVRSGKRAIISTANKALQEQLFYKDIPFVQQHVQPFEAALVKGVGNYVCLDRLDEEQHGLQFYVQDPVFNRLLDAVADDTFSGDFESLGFPLPVDVRGRVCGDSDRCAWSKCGYFADCYIRKMRERAERAQVIVVNHTLLLLDAAAEGAILPEHDVIVIDEAHHLEEEATRAFTFRAGRPLALAMGMEGTLDNFNGVEENIFMRTFEYRLYPKKEQQHLLLRCLIETRGIYNEMLALMKQQYEEKGTFPSKYDLTAAFKGRGGDYIPASTVQMLADRLSKALKRFLAGRELGVKVGFPRFKTANRWHSIQLRQHQTDFALAPDGKHLLVPKKLGSLIKIKLHRPLEGRPRTAHLVRRADGHWYVLIACEVEPDTSHPPVTCEHPSIGLDVGLKSFLTDSEGNTRENPRFSRASQNTLRRKERMKSRRKKGSKRRRKAARSVAQTHLKIKRQRRDFHFKVAKQYAQRYQVIAVEQLQILNMVQNHCLAKSIMDASWGAFLDILEVKAESAGHKVIRVNPRFTSQKCFKCGEIVQKSLSIRTHVCPFCGYIEDRDVNAAKNILAEALRPGHGLQEPTSSTG